MCEGLPNELLSMSPCDLYVHLAAKYEKMELEMPAFVAKKVKKEKKEKKEKKDSESPSGSSPEKKEKKEKKRKEPEPATIENTKEEETKKVSIIRCFMLCSSTSFSLSLDTGVIKTRERFDLIS